MEDEIRFSHISMEFPGVLANDDISLSIRRGEVFALVGENGAGKSTLMNILYGINEPTAGELFVRGQKVTAFNPRAASVIRIMATREPGIRRLTLGVRRMMRMLQRPISRDHRWVVPIFRA